MVFIDKMETVDKKRQLQDKKNYLRRQYRQQARAALFIQEYIEHKYPEIYEESVAFYNHVNSIYPEKKDLRKTEQFKALKLGFTFVAKQGDNVVKNPRQVYQPISALNQQNFTIVCYKDQQTITEQTTTEQTITEQTTTEQTITEQTTTEQTITEQTTTEQTITEQTITEQTTTEQTTTEQTEKAEKIMQLRIPLMSPGVITQTVNVVTQEIVEENPLSTAYDHILAEDIAPTLNEEILQEAFDRIMAELRQDPDLNKIIEDIELEQIDMDVDLPLEDDRLEQELFELW